MASEGVRKASAFRWSEKSEAAALALAQGKTQPETAQEVDISDRQIRRWLSDPEFSAEVDRLTLVTGIAKRAERMRITKRAVRMRVNDVFVRSERDLLDWLKYAQSETDGENVNVSIHDYAASVGEQYGVDPDAIIRRAEEIAARGRK
jgi:transposase-like protein